MLRTLHAIENEVSGLQGYQSAGLQPHKGEIHPDVKSAEIDERCRQIQANLERAERLKKELAVFVTHGDKVMERLEMLIKSVGRDKQ